MDTRWMPTVAGILSIVAGALSLAGGLIAAIILTVVVTVSNNQPQNLGFAAVAIWIVAIPFLAISAVAIAGGVFALRRKLWGLALAGAICTLFTLWAWILGIAAIVLIILSKNEFDHLYPVLPSSPEPPRDRIRNG